ncbi:hypothetical protein C7974DRAFT_169050 [Boeremia exigua]|uniref:uncharacterized protein n=1 Tax=Boeremia exigua TaxID=749465 RepID=UPI001E8CC3D9|nr:uncharacterized protein C7974DRAFT_169050 [Boeremia exigua]KAH6633296.1 hypothetical protein C7974DRAFT_169050 [Boeremia exigua]
MANKTAQAEIFEMSSKQARPKTGGYTPAVRISTHTHNILVACSLIVLPMIIFTSVALAFVFSNTVSNQGCSFDDLCPTAGLINTTSSNYYYVDFSATSLVFISSWSSTISFALVGVLMSMYAYSIAAEMLHRPDFSPQHGNAMSPYQLSLVIRVLNAEIFSLWNLVQPLGRKTLRKTSGQEYHQEVSSRPLRRSLVVFGLALFGCVCIQAADTYLHLATKAVNVLHAVPQQMEQHRLSKRIGDWCLDTETTFGTQANINFWGCGLYWNETAQVVAPTNVTLFHRIIGEPLEDYTLNYTESDGTQYAIVGPSDVSPQTDWAAASFAVSSKCSVIPQAGCKVFGGPRNFGFSCQEKNGAPMDFLGNMTDGFYSVNFGKFHTYLEEMPPFLSTFSSGVNGLGEVNETAPNVTSNDAQQLWKNPWLWHAEVSLLADEKDLPRDITETAWFLDGLGHKMVVNCSSTVYDVTYTAVGGRVRAMTKTPSNGTTTGIIIMPLVETFGFSQNLHDSAMYRASQASSVQSWLSIYELEMSKSFTVPLVVHTVPDSGIRAQKRISKVIARVPVASLWLLVLSNLAFAVLAVIVAVIALKAANGDVNQVHLRLGVSGLVAALFEPDAARRMADGESELFQENEEGAVVRTAITIEKTAAGGVAWITHRGNAPAQQSVVPRHSETSISYQPLTLAGLGDISRPLLDNEGRR